MGTLVAFVNFRTLFAMFVVVAVLFAPAVARGDALAAVPHHDMQMMQAGDCHSSTSPKGSKDGHRAGDMSCCTAISVGVAPMAERVADEPLGQVARAPVTLAAPHRPFLGELATPPPRSA